MFELANLEFMERKGIKAGEVLTSKQHLHARLNATYAHRRA